MKAYYKILDNFYKKFNLNYDNFSLYNLLKKYDQLLKIYIAILQLPNLLSIFNKQKSNGYNFLDDDWDYAIILDACRYDIFNQVNDIKGDLHKKYSKASSTLEWIEKCVIKSYKDVILITANPWLSNTEFRKLNKKPFYKIFPVWNYGWDDELMVVPPWTMVEVGKKILKKYPNNKIIFWFMQPHHPFINKKYSIKEYFEDKKRIRVWEMIKLGIVDADSAMLAYKENLKLVLIYVKLLLKHLNGKIIITSDHGNCFGELGILGHPPKIYITPLIEIPRLLIKK